MSLPELKNKLSSIVKHQLPIFVQTDHTTFVKFLEAYYEWLEKEGKAYERVALLDKYIDPDKTTDTFIDLLKKEFMSNMPEGMMADRTKVIKNLRDFYRAKGSEKSFELFFRMLYDKEVGFFYPKTNMLEASGGKWVTDKHIRVTHDGSTIEEIEGLKITGSSSGATAIVARAADSLIDDGGNDVVELTVSNVNGTFEADESFTTNDSITGMILPILTGIKITEAGEGYSPGDTVTVNDSGSGRGAEVVVDAVSSGPITGITINSGGIGYKVGDNLVFDESKTIGYSAEARVSEVDGTGAITGIEIVNGGYNYDVKPVVSVEQNSTGSGADLEASGTKIGSIQKFKFKDYGVDYSDGTTTIDLSGSGDGNATADAVVGTLAEESYYKNKLNQLDELAFLQDNFYYQEFSYELKVEKLLNEYRSAVKSVVHPAGLNLFGRYVDTQKVSAKATILNASETTSNIVTEYYTPDTPPADASYVDKWLLLFIIKEFTQEIDANANKLGPTLASIERLKFKFTPNANDATHPVHHYHEPNSDYWVTGNTQLKHLFKPGHGYEADRTVGEVVNTPGKQTKIAFDVPLRVNADNWTVLQDGEPILANADTAPDQSGMTNTEMTLAESAVEIDDLYNDHHIFITGGTGAGQRRNISDFIGSSRKITVSSAWDTQPDNTSKYEVWKVYSGTEDTYIQRSGKGRLPDTNDLNYGGSDTLKVYNKGYTTQKIVASNAAANDNFGAAVDIEEDWAVIGAPSGGASGEGTAYIFKKSSGLWTQHTELTPSGGQNNDKFGTAVAVSRNFVVVGAPSGNSGTGEAYVFKYDPVADTWDEIGQLQGTASNDEFGTAVAIDNEIVAVGAPGVSTDTGEVDIYTRTHETLNKTKTLTASDAATGDRFGDSVATFSNYVVVGAPTNDTVDGSKSGSVYVFKRESNRPTVSFSGGGGSGAKAMALVNLSGEIPTTGVLVTDGGSGYTSTPTVTISAPDSGTQAQATAEVDGGRVTGITVTNTGSGYVNPVWTEKAILTASDATGNDEFGNALDMHNNRIIVGALKAEAVYIFKGSESSWTEEAILTSDDASAGDEFGTGVAVYKNYAAIGAPKIDSNQGAVYVFLYKDGSWSQINKHQGVSEAGDEIGSDVAIYGEVIAGEPLEDGSTDAGAAEFFSLDPDADAAALLRFNLDPLLYQSTESDPTTYKQKEQLRPTLELQADDQFGYSVTIRENGDWAAIGVPLSSSSDNGKVFIYKRDGESWTLKQEIDGDTPGVRFGEDLSMSGDYFAIGVPEDESISTYDGVGNYGGVDMYKLESGFWRHIRTITPETPNANGEFGTRVELKDNRIIVAEKQAVAYIFKRSGDDWVKEKKLEPSGGESSFGSGVGIYGNYAAVGCDDDDAAYIYEFGDDGWTEKKKITTTAGYDFGTDVSVHDGIIAVSAPERSNGYIYVYLRDNDTGTWSEDATISKPGVDVGTEFARRIVVINRTIYAGSPESDGDDGFVYVFKKHSGSWTNTQTFQSNTATGNDEEFGYDLDVSETCSSYVIAGAPGLDDGGDTDVGAAYIFKSPLYINNIILSLATENMDSDDPQNIELWLVDGTDKDWTPGTSNGSTEAGKPNWNQKEDGSTNWNGSNSDGEGTPPVPVGTTVKVAEGKMGESLTNLEFNEAIDLNILLDWAVNPSNNAGFVLVSPDDKHGVDNTIYSEDHYLQTFRPKLSVSFDTCD